MASLKALLSAPFHQFIHKDFHEAVAKMTLTDASLFLVKSMLLVKLIMTYLYCHVIVSTFKYTLI